MPDLTSQLLSALQMHRIEGLELGGDFLYPNYSGQSVLNIPSSICICLGVPEFGAPALRSEILSPLGGPYKRVILLLVDALALHLLRTWMQEPDFAIWRQLAERGLLAPLTSVTPSTTCAALTSLWTGVAPGEHGVAGYELWLKEYGVVANMILHSPFSFEKQAGALRSAGFVAEQFLGLPTFGQHLSAHGVQAYALQDYSILGSGLSNMFFRMLSELDISLLTICGSLYANYWRPIQKKKRFIGSIGPRSIPFPTNSAQMMSAYAPNLLPSHMPLKSSFSYGRMKTSAKIRFSF